MFPVRARWLLAILIAGSMVIAESRPADAVPINDAGTINVSLRAYANIRVGTNAKQSTREGCEGAECRTPLAAPPSSFGGTFVYSGAGNLLQNRYFVDVELDHDLLPMFDDFLPKWVTSLEYTLGYRGEYEGIYDFGPSAFRNPDETYLELQAFLRPGPDLPAGADRSARQHDLLRPPPPAAGRELSQSALPGVPRCRDGRPIHPRGSSEPRLGRNRRLPAARQHQPGRQQLRRVLHRSRRAARAAQHDPGELLHRLDRRVHRSGVHRGLCRLRQHRRVHPGRARGLALVDPPWVPSRGGPFRF